LKRGDILLVTDGVNPKRAEKVINDMIEQGYRISILGVGTPQGGPVRLGSGGFLKDSDGAIVIPELAIANLRDLARLGRGIYRTLSIDDSDVSALLAPLGARPGQEEVEATRLTADVWRDRGPWLLLALVPLAALGFRRGSLMIVMISGVLVPGPAKALDWASLWLRPDQQAIKALKEGNRERAARLFTDPKWKAAALYRSGDYEAALESLAGLDDPDSLYNKGNALARLGRYPEAIEAYDKALALKPDHEDARHNRDLLNQLAREQSRQTGGERSEADPRDAQQDGPAQQGRSDTGPEQNADHQKNNGDHEQSNPQGQTQGAAGHSAERQEQASEPGQRDGAPSASPLASAGSKKLPQGAVEGKLAVNGQPGPKPEADQAVEQWLRRIPDDPGGLLRRKFYYQYQQRGEPQLNDDQPW
jgi:Ca-activated chloride channel family protein